MLWFPKLKRTGQVPLPNYLAKASVPGVVCDGHHYIWLLWLPLPQSAGPRQPGANPCGLSPAGCSLLPEPRFIGTHCLRLPVAMSYLAFPDTRKQRDLSFMENIKKYDAHIPSEGIEYSKLGSKE